MATTRSAPFKLEESIVSNWNANSKDPLTTYLKSTGLKGKAINIGSVQFDTAREWQKHGGAKKSFGKSDISIGKASISLKSTNNHLIFSGAKGESKALFLSVANKTAKKRLAAIVDDVIKSLDDMVSSGITSSTVAKAKKTDYIIQQAGLIHESIKAEIIEMFNNNTEFKNHCIREMISGQLKFGPNSPGSAEYILYADVPELISIDGTKIFDHITTDIRVDFKSQSAPTHIPLGSYRFWSVVQLIQKKLRLDEGIDILGNIRTYIRTLFNYLRSLLIDDWGQLLEFMEIEIQ
jgi:hypothetical protein